MHRYIVAAIIWVILTTGLASAQGPIPRESGFSGYIEVLGAYISTDSQLNTDNENKITQSLDGPGERTGNLRALPLGLIGYTFAEQRTQVFLGALPENVSRGRFQVEVGARHELADGTELRASMVPWTPIEQETWEDPFVVGRGRERTDVSTLGAKFEARRIIDSPWTVKYDWLQNDVDAERSGTFLLSQQARGLRADDLSTLDRDADRHRVSAEYAFKITPKSRLTPIVEYTYADASGDAYSYQALSPKLSYIYFSGSLQASITASFESSWYDGTHPVFDETREETQLGIFAILGYKNPFGFKDFRVDWFSGYFNNSANIDFYDSSSFVTAVGLGYVF